MYQRNCHQFTPYFSEHVLLIFFYIWLQEVKRMKENKNKNDENYYSFS